MKHYNILFFIAVIIFVTGCGTSSVKPETKIVIRETPQWVNSVLPNDDSTYMYGMAISKNRQDAIKIALSDVIARLGTSIESSYESIQKVHGAYNDLKIQSKIKADVAKIKINNYKVIKSYKLNYREFAIMISIEKKKFINGLLNDLETQKKSIEQRKNYLKNMQSIARYNLSKKLAKEANELLPVIYILVELDPLFAKDKNLGFVSKMQKLHLREAEQLQFFVRGDKRSSKFVEKIKNNFARQGFKISSSKRGSVEIRLSTHDNVNRSYIKIAVLTLNIVVIDRNRRVGGREIIIKERYNNSIESVYKNAAIHFENDIKSEGINKLIGIQLNLE